MNRHISTFVANCAVLLFLGIFSPGGAHAQRAVIAFDGVEIYALPMVDDSPISVLAKGNTVRVIGQRGDWVKVEIEKGKKGWMQVQVDKNGKRKPRRRHARYRGSNVKGGNSLRSKNGIDGMKTVRNDFAGGNSNIVNVTEPVSSMNPDIDMHKSRPMMQEQEKSRFGYSFGLGLLETDFTYNWKFIYKTTPRLSLVGSFKHALGDAANSYFIMVNWNYALQESGKIIPYLTGGLGVINTVPERSIALGSVSHITVNYGVGAHKRFRRNATITAKISAYTVFVGKGMRHFKEFTVGFMVGNFWH